MMACTSNEIKCVQDSLTETQISLQNQPLFFSLRDDEEHFPQVSGHAATPPEYYVVAATN